ncbi:MAG: FAD-dependent oxidoreductase [Clostridiaceae bacterium]|nr:FAD-dependent oxidoreductase [Clostridiaceae bacterium]
MIEQLAGTDGMKTTYADVFVAGGGPAGVCAAIAAAREGAATVMAEQGGCAGGMATQGLVGPFMTCYDKDGENMIIRGLFAEIVDRLVKRGGAIHPSQVRKGTAFTSWIRDGHDHVTPFDPEILKMVLDEMLEEAGVEVLYHTTFTEPVMEKKKVTGVILHSKSGFERINANVVIDCTGDGDVAYRAGVPWEMGDEKLNLIQPATLFFRICNVDTGAVEADITKNRENFYRKDGINYRSFHWWVSEARKHGEWSLDRVSVGLYRGVKPDEWCVNTSRIMGIDSTDNRSLSKGEMEGRRQVEEILHMIRTYIPGCGNAKLMSTASSLGIRESRHIRGEYRLTLEDILQGKVPDDRVLVCSNSVDVHGRYGPRSNEYLTIEKGAYYGVPYGCLVPCDVDGLLVAGRCISAESQAAGAVRVMPPVMAMGQAAGMAAAISVKTGKEVRFIDRETLKERLIENQVYLG